MWGSPPVLFGKNKSCNPMEPPCKFEEEQGNKASVLQDKAYAFTSRTQSIFKIQATRDTIYELTKVQQEAKTPNKGSEFNTV
jgi:hypothetical protein